MKLTYLGTAAAEGIPAIFCECEACVSARKEGGKALRTRSGALIDETLKLDFGPDSYPQMLSRGLSLANVKNVLITHSHEDHLNVFDLTLRRPITSFPKTVPCMTVYGNARTEEKLSSGLSDHMRFSRVKEFEPLRIGGYTVTPLQAVHCIDANGSFPVIFEGREYTRSEEAFIYLIEKDGKRLLYAHDTDELTQANLEYLSGKHLDLVSLDCTNGTLQASYVGHMGAEDNLRTREALFSVKAADEKTVFVANHFSHNGYPSEARLQAALPGFLIAYDGMTVEI